MKIQFLTFPTLHGLLGLKKKTARIDHEPYKLAVNLFMTCYIRVTILKQIQSPASVVKTM